MDENHGYILLTLAESKDRVWVKANKIVSIYDRKDYTEVRVDDPHVFYKVSDASEDIFAKLDDVHPSMR